MKRIILLLMLIVCCQNITIAQPKNYLLETKAQKDTRMAWWRDAKFGMFIHWGLYAVLGGEHQGKDNYGEWIMDQANIPIPEYEKLTAEFNPVRFNADEWVRIAKDAGMKYIVITSKHHEGFSMWNSATARYDIADQTPFKRDVLKELSVACKKAGIALGFYYSIMDWHHPDAKGANFAKYRDTYMKPQLKELITQYDPTILWFDGEWIDEWTEDQGKELYNFVRHLKPNILINNRVGKGRNGMQGMNAYENAAGDFGTPEQEILEGTSDTDWESCMTMNTHWGWNKKDKNFKSSQNLIHNLIDIAAKGGNYLLNVGPTELGEIPSESVVRLAEMGKWLRINGESVYRTKALRQYHEGESIRFTQSQNGRFIYTHLLEKPQATLRLRYVKPKRGSRIVALGDPQQQALSWRDEGENGVVITIPERLQNISEYALVLKMQATQNQVTEKPDVLNADGQRTHHVLFTEKAQAILLSPTENATLHYTLDGSEPTRLSPIYTAPISLNQSTTIKAIAIKQGMIQSLVTTATFSKIQSVKSVQMDVQPNAKYAGMGALTLMDGKHAPPNTFTDKGWLGWDGTDVKITVDLGEERMVQFITLSFLQNQASWIFLPKAVWVETSIDNYVYFRTQTTVTTKVDPSEFKDPEPVKMAIHDRVRFLRFTIQAVKTCPEWHVGAGGKCWVFMDEITVE